MDVNDHERLSINVDTLTLFYFICKIEGTFIILMFILQYERVGKSARSTRLLQVSVEDMKEELETEVRL